MRRRDFIAILGGAAMWPLVSRAEQPSVPVIGFLGSASADGYAPYVGAFLRGLKETGYVAGQNVTIEFRWAEGQYDRLPALAAELVARNVNLIAAAATPASIAAKAATSTIPIVFSAGTDAVAAGLVGSLNRPTGNVTGVSQIAGDLGAKRLSIIHELVPTNTAVAILVNPDSATSLPEMKDTLDAAEKLSRQVFVVKASTESELDRAFTTIAERAAGALLVTADAFFLGRRHAIAAQAAAHALPTIYFAREFVPAGGLISYAPDISDGYRQVGVYAGRILKGARIADLPVTQPTKFQLAINLRTAKALGLDMPSKLLALADEVIE
jgi:putative ABC transport system substrate-binding protein